MNRYRAEIQFRHGHMRMIVQAENEKEARWLISKQIGEEPTLKLLDDEPGILMSYTETRPGYREDD